MQESAHSKAYSGLRLRGYSPLKSQLPLKVEVQPSNSEPTHPDRVDMSQVCSGSMHSSDDVVELTDLEPVFLYCEVCHFLEHSFSQLHQLVIVPEEEEGYMLR